MPTAAGWADALIAPRAAAAKFHPASSAAIISPPTGPDWLRVDNYFCAASHKEQLDPDLALYLMTGPLTFVTD